jgi:hypothetical protein
MEGVMTKWSGNYLQDSLKLLKKVEKELAKVVDRGEPCHAYEEMEYGEYSVAISLQRMIKKWRREMFNEEGEK